MKFMESSSFVSQVEQYPIDLAPSVHHNLLAMTFDSVSAVNCKYWDLNQSLTQPLKHPALWMAPVGDQQFSINVI